MGTVVWIVVGVVVLLVLAGLAVGVSRKRRETRHRQAHQLRREAVAEASGLQESGRTAREAKAQADRARAEAERAEARAVEAEREHQHDQARHEDRLREADRLDPQVDHRADDYQPGSHSPDTGARATEDPVHEPPRTDKGGSHRA